MLICDGYVKVRESLNAWVIFWISTILGNIDTTTVLSVYEDSCMVPEGYRKQLYHHIPIPYQCNVMWYPRYRQLYSIKKDDTSSTPM